MNVKQLHSLGLHVNNGPEWTLDVVCGMEIDPRTTPYKHEYNDTVYYFCGKNCLQHFTDNPRQYVA
jgi:YHS domain-containing protein